MRRIYTDFIIFFFSLFSAQRSKREPLLPTTYFFLPSAASNQEYINNFFPTLLPSYPPTFFSIAKSLLALAKLNKGLDVVVQVGMNAGGIGPAHQENPLRTVRLVPARGDHKVHDVPFV